jgi:hypothetical protein
MNMRVIWTFLLLVLGAALPSGAAAAGCVAASDVKPQGPWKDYPTRTLESLPAAATSKLDGALSQYGGLAARKTKATGFFYPARIDGRWWLVDPEGCLFLSKAVNSVAMLQSQEARATCLERFGSETNWANRATALLRDARFNGTGSWSDIDRLRGAFPRLVYCRHSDFMGNYGRKRGGTYQQAGHLGYPNDCLFVFDPAFETFCDEYAKQLAADKDDPWLLGHFTDNELPFKLGMLTNYLKLPDAEPGCQAAQAWLKARRGENAGPKDVTAQDEQDFLAVVVDRYFRIVSGAIRRYDPNHLVLGSRFHGKALRLPEVVQAAGPYLDVISVNLYHVWTPDPNQLALWERLSGRPVLVTEWYAKGMDSGMANNTGAGWVVKTQKDRGQFYQNFTLALLESKACVGWHWFKYIDNDPNAVNADPSNLDSNKGILSNRYEPYLPLLEAMTQLNRRAYSLAQYFSPPSPAKTTAANRQARTEPGTSGD